MGLSKGYTFYVCLVHRYYISNTYGFNTKETYNYKMLQSLHDGHFEVIQQDRLDKAT